MDPKVIKAMLMQAACALAAAGSGSTPGAPDPKIVNPDTQNRNIELVQEVTIFYGWLLAAWQGNGVNPDGSKNAFLDPAPGAALPKPTATAPSLPPLPTVTP